MQVTGGVETEDQAADILVSHYNHDAKDSTIKFRTICSNNSKSSDRLFRSKERPENSF